MGFIAFERGLRNIPEARGLYKRCYNRRFADGSQPAMCQAWLRFEREEGRSVTDRLFADSICCMNTTSVPHLASNQMTGPKYTAGLTPNLNLHSHGAGEASFCTMSAIFELAV